MPLFFRLCALSCCILAVTFSGLASAQLQLHVNDNGYDAWSGSSPAANAEATDGPLATIQGARDRIRAYRADHGALPEGGVEVHIGSTQRLNESLVFGPEDSGTAEAPIVYRGTQSKPVALSGGITLPLSRWEEEGELWVVHVPEWDEAQGIPLSFWTQGERRTRARTPNAAHRFGDYPPGSDFFRTTGPVKVETDDGEADSVTAFRFNQDELQDWDSLPHATVVVFHSWATSLLRVKEVDWEQDELHFTGPARWHFTRWQQNQRYFIENLREGLDEAGEWHWDPETKHLRYIPLPEEAALMAAGDDATWQATIPVVEKLVVLAGVPEEERFVEHLHFRNLAFEYSHFPLAPEGHSDAQAAFAVSAAVEVVGARHCHWESCEIRHTSNHGLWLRRGAQDNTIRQTHFHDLGAGGVRIGEGASPATPGEAADRNTLDNSLLEEGGRIFRSAVGVWLGRASHNEVTHNEIRHFRYTGVSVGWSWGYAESSANHNIIAYNHIHQIGLGQLNDMGGIYTLGVSPGTVLRGNVIHDVRSHPELYGGWGLYTDEGSTDILLEGNLVYNTQTGGFHQHYGKDNRIVNNIFAYSHSPQIIRTRAEEHNSFFFENNIVYYNNNQLLGSNWSGSNYVLKNNLYWNTSGPVDFNGKDLEAWQAEGHDAGSVIADPLFRDPDKGDFRFQEDSPALEHGFQPIDCNKAGLYGPEDWKAKGSYCLPPATPLPEAP